MKHLHRLVLRALPGPFLGWLGTFVFILVLQFLMRYLPDIVGKGLPLQVIAELIVYSLAGMVVLAVPMSVLIASLMAFGTLAETNAYMVVKSSGVSLPRLMWPALVLAGLLTMFMVYFNNEVLPEANFRVKSIWIDIHRAKPGFQLQQGVFYQGLTGYSILARRIPPDSSYLGDLLVYDYTEGGAMPTIIKAQKGQLESEPGSSRIALVLEGGEVHRYQGAGATGTETRYERMAFDKFRMFLDLSDFGFTRSSPEEAYRADRSMPTSEMVLMVDSLRGNISEGRQALMRTSLTLARDTVQRVPGSLLPATSGVTSGYVASLAPDTTLTKDPREIAAITARQVRAELEEVRRAANWEKQRVDRYSVEIHKKQSLALACLVFMMLGAPLGLRIKRGGLTVSGLIATGILIFFYVSLVQGEKLADRDLLEPWLGMWLANIILGIGGVVLIVYVTLDVRSPALIRRLKNRLWRI